MCCEKQPWEQLCFIKFLSIELVVTLRSIRLCDSIYKSIHPPSIVLAELFIRTSSLNPYSIFTPHSIHWDSKLVSTTICYFPSSIVLSQASTNRIPSPSHFHLKSHSISIIISINRPLILLSIHPAWEGSILCPYQTSRKTLHWLMIPNQASYILIHPGSISSLKNLSYFQKG